MKKRRSMVVPCPKARAGEIVAVRNYRTGNRWETGEVYSVGGYFDYDGTFCWRYTVQIARPEHTVSRGRTRRGYTTFALTTRQIRERSKTVTRRLGWRTLKPGTLLQPVVKGMGLRKGETVEKIGGAIRVVAVSREPLGLILGQPGDLAREGFPAMTGVEFVNMFCDHNGCEPDDAVTRIEFGYVEESQQEIR